MRRKIALQIDTVHWNIVCDLCGKKDVTPTPQYSFGQCKCCKRDICNQCRRQDYYWSDDKPDLYCIDCYENGRHFRELRELEDIRHDERQKDIQKRWYVDAQQYVRDKDKDKEKKDV